MEKMTTRQKRKYTPDAHEWMVGGLFCGPNFKVILNSFINTHKLNKDRKFFPVPMRHNKHDRTCIALFVCTQNGMCCVLFERKSGDVSMHQVHNIPVEFDIPNDAMWDDDYVVNKNWTAHSNVTLVNVELKTISDATFSLAHENDMLYNFNKSRSTLSSESRPLPNAMLGRVSKGVALLNKTRAWQHALLFCMQRKPNNAADDRAIVINLCGATCNFVHIDIRKAAIDIRSHGITLAPRASQELDISNTTWDDMEHTALLSFTKEQFANIHKQTLTNDGLDALQTQSHFLCANDGTLCDTWMKFVRHHLPPQICFSSPFVTIELLQIPSAMLKFQAQVLEMRALGTEIDPKIMFHGIRSADVLKTVQQVRNVGFNPKCTKNTVYGAGGTYCSPQFACALEYTVPVAKNNPTRFIFVCMVVPGKVCFGGQCDQQMDANQNAWCANLDRDGYQMYCAETILPFALLSFQK